MSPCTALLIALMWSAVTQPQAVGVFADGRVEAWDLEKGSGDGVAPLHVWVWSAASPPERLRGSALQGEPPHLSSASRRVRVTALPQNASERRLRLYAAPVESIA